MSTEEIYGMGHCPLKVKKAEFKYKLSCIFKKAS
jgi:hypothetical protein